VIAVRIHNVLAHPITEKIGNGDNTKYIEINPTGFVLRLDIFEEVIGFTETGAPIVQRHQIVDISELPPEKEGILYLVSAKIIESLSEEKIGRGDFVCIDTEKDLTGEHGAEWYAEGALIGKIKACKRYRRSTKTIVRR
jgi:hypothetical protein